MKIFDKTTHKQGGVMEMVYIALPMLVANACDTVIIFTDRLFVAKLGSVQMNASLMGGLSAYMMMTFFIGLTGYSSALVAQYLGANKKSRCSFVLSQSIIIAVLAYPILLCCRPLVHQLFVAFHVEAEQMLYQIEYFDILSHIIIFSLLRNCFNSFYAGIGRTRIIMISSFATMIINVILNYALIFGKFGLPAYGMKGAAYGSILACLVGVIILARDYLSRVNCEEFGVTSSFKFDKDIMLKLIRFGYPSGVEMFMNILSFTMMILIFHSVSQSVATAATIVFNWDIVSYVPLLGVEIGVTSLVGRYMGAQRPDIAHAAMKSGVKFGMCFSAIVFAAYTFIPEQMVAVFRPINYGGVFAQSVPMAVTMLRLASFYILAEVFMLSLIGALRGAGDTLWAMILTVGMHWIMLPILYFTLHVADQSAEVAWITIIATFYVFLLLVWWRYKSGAWRKMKIV